MKNWMTTKPPSGIHLNYGHPLAQGLVGCWLFNEGAGLRANDLSGNQNTGVLTNMEPFSTARGWTGGNFGTSMAFNGVAGFIDCGNKPIIRGQNFVAGTWEAWVFVTTTASNQTLMQQSAGAGQSYRLWIFNPTLSFRLSTYGLTNTALDSIIPSSAINNWSNVIGTWDGRFLRLYYNGVLKSGPLASSGTMAASTNSLTIGGGGGVGFLNGKLGVIRVWNRALNFTEIMNLYAQPFSMFRIIKN